MIRIILTLLMLPFFGFAKEDLSKLNPMQARGFFITKDLVAGQLADLQIEMQLQDGFFAYLERFKLKVVEPENTQVGELDISPIVDFDDSISKKIKKGVKTAATLKTQVEIPQNATELKSLKFVMTYIACTKKFCLTPRKVNFDIDISKAVVMPSKPENLLSTASIVKTIDENLALALIFIFFVGMITSLTPCVYPLIPITLAVLGNNKDRPKLQSFFVSLSYVIGIGITYALLGVLAARTGALFGSFISHPAVIVSMSLIFFIMGLSMLGLFEIQAPGFIRDRMAKTNSGGGLAGAFFSGLLAGVIASPCVGPVLVGILAYIAKTQSSALGFVLLFSFAMGFGTLFIVLGTFSHLAGKLPRSGAWMNTIKTTLALALFAMSFYYAWPLIKKQFPETAVVQTKNKVAWKAFSPELVEDAKKQGLPVIVDFYADWCAACVEMDQFTFSKTEVIKLSKKFVMLKVDATSPFDELSDWQQTYNVYGLPTMILIDPAGNVREDLTLTGFEEAQLFVDRMKQAMQ